MAGNNNRRAAAGDGDNLKRKYDKMNAEFSNTKKELTNTQTELTNTRKELKTTQEILDDVMALEYKKNPDGNKSKSKDGKLTNIV